MMKRILDFRFWILDWANIFWNPKSKIQNPKSAAQLLGFALVLLLSAVEAAQACPGCKEALFDPGQLPQRLSAAKGYALTIGLLLLVPFALIGSVTALIVRSTRRR